LATQQHALVEQQQQQVTKKNQLIFDSQSQGVYPANKNITTTFNSNLPTCHAPAPPQLMQDTGMQRSTNIFCSALSS